MKTTLAPLALLLGLVICLSVSCRKQPEIAIPAISSALIREINFEEYRDFTADQLQVIINDFSLLNKPFSQYKKNYSYDSLNRLQTQTINTADQNITVSRFSYVNNKMIRLYTAGQWKSVDTVYLNKSGIPTELNDTWDNYYKRQFLFTYNNKGQLIGETHYTATGCGFMYMQFDMQHSIVAENRTTTRQYYRLGWTESPVDEKSSQVVYNLKYEYDLTKPNPGVPYDNFKLASGCSGIIDPVNFDPNQSYNRSRNLLKHVTVVSEQGERTYSDSYDYYYEFDSKGRVSTLYLVNVGILGRSVLKRTFQYID
jgi:hypothetical protein